jgi:phage tail sheath gpL-like
MRWRLGANQKTMEGMASMEKVIVDGKELDVKVGVSGGFVTLTADYQGAETGAALSVKVSVDNLLDKLAEAVPGKIDDAIIQVVKAALKMV